MDDSKLLLYLQWFYTLELAQVDFYLTQSKKSEDEYIDHMLLHLVERELIHAERVSKYIKIFNGVPTKMGSMLSRISGFLSEFTVFTGTVNMFTLNYYLETLAFNDYGDFLIKVDTSSRERREMVDELFKNMMDEDLHRNWFISRREALKKIKKEKK